jgi:two-component system cell cycle sensor histidine kinase/response regulator CckA
MLTASEGELPAAGNKENPQRMPKILVVEDQVIVARGVQAMLERLGYEVPVIAFSGEAAIHQIEVHRPDLVLMDIVLKGEIDGIQATEQIRARLDIPVVYVTAYADQVVLERAKVTDPFGYIIKPFDARELATAIEMALYKHQMERRLRESERHFRALIENTSDIIITLDRSGAIRYASPAVGRLLGYRAEDVIGQDVLDLLHPEDAPRAQAALADAVQTPGASPPVEVRVRHQDGSWLPFEAVGSNMLDDPAVGTIIVNIRDLSARNQAREAALRASRLEAAATLASGIAHKLNNLMVGVLGYAELLREDLILDAEASDTLDVISTSARQASDLARQMLAFARGGRYQPQAVDLNEIVARVLESQRAALPPGIHVTWTAEPDLRAVQADPAQMGQVILNLYTNAVEAIADQGQVILCTRNLEADEAFCLAHPGLEPGAHVCLSVQDTGCGMSPQVQARAFEPFFTTKFKGRGMGLAAAYGIVQNHGGHIAIQSQEGQGSTFEVVLPARP